MDARSGFLDFHAGRGDGLQMASKVFNFDVPVTQAVAALTGMRFGFVEGDDHELGKVTAVLRTSIDSDVVTVEGDLGVRDWSNDWDDPFEGQLTFLLLAELDRGFVNSNLTITGVEHSQAIQFFRTQDHLGSGMLQADNSIPLISGKDTVLRTYIDDLADPARPTITAISGLLSIRLPGSGSWTDIEPLNGPIGPRRDMDIDRRQSDHTLNFVIPGAFTAPSLDIRIRVFEASQPDVPGYTSASVFQTLGFQEAEPLRVRGIGIRYTGFGPNPVPPTSSTLANILDTVEAVYPVGQTIITGYDTITFAGNLTTDAGREDLLDDIRDMVGDSHDFHYGMLPVNVPTGYTVGSAELGGRAAWGKVGIASGGFIAAHEIGHNLDRRHPCGNGSLDANYPDFDEQFDLPNASIYEIGIDADGTVQNPSDTLDFMAQLSCGPSSWVSPYTYLSLRQSFRQTLAFNAANAPGDGDTLFLNFRIHNGADIEFRPSFHFPARRLRARGLPTPYWIVFKDCDGKVIASYPVEHTDPTRMPDDPFLGYYQPLPFPTQTAEIRVLTRDAKGCGEAQIATLPVPCCAPSVSILAPRGRSAILEDLVDVVWEVCECDKETTLTYLLRYSNDCGRSWRTLAPRTTKTRQTVDMRSVAGGNHCMFQVLATSGIRTSRTNSEPFAVPVKLRTIQILPPKATVFEPDDHVALSAIVFSPDFDPPGDAEVEWRSSIDGKIGIGPRISAVTLSEGCHEISVCVNDGKGGVVRDSLEISIYRQSTDKLSTQTPSARDERKNKPDAEIKYGKTKSVRARPGKKQQRTPSKASTRPASPKRRPKNNPDK